MPDFAWILRMAWRDFRHSRKQLSLFILSILVGIAALVGILSFGEAIQREINEQARELAGADLILYNNRPLDSLSLDLKHPPGAREISFASMVQAPKNDENRLSNVRALEGKYPFYGSLRPDPAHADSLFHRNGPYALLERLLAEYLGLTTGDSVQVGEAKFEVVGIVDQVPGSSGITSMVAPTIYIPYDHLEKTGLVQYGSRLNYTHYYQLSSEIDIEELIEEHREEWSEAGLAFETVDSRKEGLGKAFKNLTGFLALVAFVALLLGCVGVASTVNVFIKQKLHSIAILRCLGLSTKQIFLIYLSQIGAMGLFGALLGTALGLGLQGLLPLITADFLPFTIEPIFSWTSVATGILTGLIISILFALIPLSKIRYASPMLTLRPEMKVGKGLRDGFSYLIIFGILLFIYLFSWFSLSSWTDALFFTAFIVMAFLSLWGLALLVMKLIKKYIPIALPYPLRQALSNLYRPHNQTISLIASIGLGTAMLGTLFFIQENLLQEVKLADQDEQPNLVLFDIQSQQLEDVKELVATWDLPLMQEVPVVTMRLQSINGLKKQENDSLDEGERKPKGLYRREFRVTYRDELISSEKLVEGKLRPVKSKDDSIFVSFDAGYAKRAGLSIGDEIIFNVQGRPLKTYLGSLREVNYRQVSTNFLVLFPENVLENAPKFHVIVSRAESDRQAADAQKAIIKAFPNVSAVNLAMILDTFEGILQKISFAIQFMALFSIITGLIVLISSLIMSKYQRMKESVLLKSLGASSRQINLINGLEYLFLGSLAALGGLVLSYIATGLLSVLVFEVSFRPIFWQAFILFLIITSLTLGIGWWNSRQFKHIKPMEVLRA